MSVQTETEILSARVEADPARCVLLVRGAVEGMKSRELYRTVVTELQPLPGDAIRAGLPRPSRFVLDLGDCPLIDTQGVNTLIGIMRYLKPHGVPLVFSGMNTSIQEKLERMGILPLFRLFPALKDAVWTEIAVKVKPAEAQIPAFTGFSNGGYGPSMDPFAAYSNPMNGFRFPDNNPFSGAIQEITVEDIEDDAPQPEVSGE